MAVGFRWRPSPIELNFQVMEGIGPLFKRGAIALILALVPFVVCQFVVALML